MKIFLVKNSICHWQTPYTSLRETVNKYPSDKVFVEAPDYVFEGWGYDDTAEGEARFIKPTPPEGWLYDQATGSFYLPDVGPPPKQIDPLDAALELLIEQEVRITLLELEVI